MALILSILLSLAAGGILFGRVYELLTLTDPQTGFLLSNGVVFSPYILILFVIITICCGILIFSDIKSEKMFFPRQAGFLPTLAGISLLCGILVNMLSYSKGESTFTTYNLFFTFIGGIGLILLGVFELKGKKSEITIVLFLTVFIIGRCLNSIIFNVSTIYNIDFLKDSLSTIAAAIFFLAIFKNVYSPSKYAKMYIYISGILAAIFCGIMYLADIIYVILKGSVEINVILFATGYVLLGIYGGFAAFLSIPNGKIEVTMKEYEPEALKSIKVLDQTQELKILKKSTQEIEIKEKEYNSAKKFFNTKVISSNLKVKSITAFKDEISKEQPSKEIENRLNEYHKDNKPIDSSEKNMKTEKIVYKKPKE